MLTAAIAFALTAGQVPADVHKGYAAILASRVANGRVDYKSIEKNDLGKLDTYLAAVGASEVPAARNERLGFYIDAYNALVIRAVIREGRPRSVLDVKGFFGEKKYTVAGRNVTLDALEKQVINPFAKDPRTHFVLVCAAVGCPILEGKVFFGTDVNARMDVATRRYLASPTGAVIDAGAIRLSKIFDWYKADFGGESGRLSFVRKHLGDDTRAKLGDAPTVGFIDYNWTLNQQ